MTVPVKIVFAIPELDAGGPDRVFHEIITGIDRTRFKPTLVVSKPGGRYFRELPHGTEVEVLAGSSYPVRRFAALIDRLSPDLIFTTLRMNATAAAARLFQKQKVPLIARQANANSADFAILRSQKPLKFFVAERVLKMLLRIPDVLVAQSIDMAAELEAIKARTQRVELIGNPINTSLLRSRYLEGNTRPSPKQGKPDIIAVGRLAPQKGFEMLIGAFRELRAHYPNATLTIFGEGPDRRKLEKQIQEVGLSGYVNLPGAREDVLYRVAEADLFVSSSKYEGFSNAILESLALETPVVATDSVGATKEMIIDGVTGTLVREFTEKSLTRGMIHALSSDRAAIAGRALLHVETQFGHTGILARYEDMFLQAVTRR